jgi:hypothetical protein
MNIERCPPEYIDLIQPEIHDLRAVSRDGIDSLAVTPMHAKLPIHIRSSLFKRNMRVDTVKLLETAPLHDLREWCTYTSLSPSGNRHHKSSFAMPLIDRFWPTFQYYHALDFDALRTCGTTVGSRATTRDGVMYDLLQNKFPVAFLRKILNVSTVNFNASKRAQRVTKNVAANADIFSQHDHLVNSWPQLPDSRFVLQRCADYVKATSIASRQPCICCGRSFFFNGIV